MFARKYGAICKCHNKLRLVEGYGEYFTLNLEYISSTFDSSPIPNQMIISGNSLKR